MTPVKRRVNATYHWMEGNVVTAILVSSGLSAALAVVLVGALGLYTSATFQSKTACTKDPAGRECAEIRLEVAEAEPLRNPCTSYQRVTGRKGKNCKQRFVGERRVRANSQEVQDLEVGGQGSAPIVGQSPSLSPPDPGSVDAPGPHNPVSRGPKPPAAPRPEGSGDQGPAATPPADTGSTASTDTPGNGNGPPEGMPEQAAGPFGSLTNSVGGAVNEAGKGLDKAACPVVDRLTGLCSVLSP